MLKLFNQISEQGSHSELLKANGLYARLHAQGFKSDVTTPT